MICTGWETTTGDEVCVVGLTIGVGIGLLVTGTFGWLFYVCLGCSTFGVGGV